MRFDAETRFDAAPSGVGRREPPARRDERSGQAGRPGASRRDAGDARRATIPRRSQGAGARVVNASIRTQRKARLREVMARHELDAVVLVPGPNLRYVTGAQNHPSERRIAYVGRRDGRELAVLPALELGSFRSGGEACEVVTWTDATGDVGAFREVAERLELRGARIGVEDVRMRVFELDALRNAAGDADVVRAHDAVSSVRLRKDASEIEAIERAVELSERALEHTLEQVRVGMTEREVFERLDAALRDAGSHGPAFDAIVATGPNAANPHAVVRDDARIEPGHALLFDFGGSYRGYPADITRTVFVGHVPEGAAALYEAVRDANEAGRRAVVPGATAGSVDEAASRVLRERGFGDLVLHRTGHGLGLEVHEAPYLTAGNDQVLEPGMVMTIEPGLYAADRFGVRIEDDVVVTEGGHRSFTSFPRDLRVVGG